jgi:D-3-phosphoglycerate dehydrogenase
MTQIAIIDGGYRTYEFEKQLFASYGYELSIGKGKKERGPLPFEFARNALGILVRDTPIGAAELDKMPDLKAIVRYGVGYDNIDLEEAKKRGIRIANVQGYANHSVSDHALALMFACTRNLKGSKFEAFGKPEREEVFELHDKTLGIIGIGRIGSQLALKAAPLFKNIWACDPYKSEDHMKALQVKKADLEDLLKESHVISIHCNLTLETKHLLNESSLRKAAQKPVIINTARGAVIREMDLLGALESGRIHSAGIDVFENEPVGPAQSELLAHPRVVSTPHVAWYSDYAMKTIHSRAAENMIGLLNGSKVDDEL